MTKKESLALFQKGRDAWNAWANDLLAKRKKLEAAGDWIELSYVWKLNKLTRDWHMAAKVDFKGHSFKEEVDFSGFIFPGRARFDLATFHGAAGFGGAQFKNCATFHSARFLSHAWFDEALFTAYAGFRDVTFECSAGFKRATFQRDVGFDNAAFRGEAWFGFASFSGVAWFEGTSYQNEAHFVQAVFGGYTNFHGARFEKSASFDAIEAKSAFSLSGTKFLTVPDFVQAHFAEAPRLDDIRIQAGRAAPWTWAGTKMLFKGDADLAARWRALKRLCIQGQDHEREQFFFKEELKARRWSTDTPRRGRFWFGLFYEWLSDFGRSFWRPFCWWVASIAIFASLYLGEHLARSGYVMSGFTWALQRTTGLGGAAPKLFCIEGPGEPWVAAFDLSLSRALVVIGLDATDKQNKTYRCLYGTYPSNHASQGSSPEAFLLETPKFVFYLGLLQNVFSAALIFLFLLALRNHFRIR